MSSPTKKTPIKFARRTSSGRVVSLSRDDDIDLGVSGEFTSASSGGPNDYMNYTVLMPPTPDNQPYAAPSGSSGSRPDDLPPPAYGTTTRRVGRRGGGQGEEGGGGGGAGEDAAGKLDRRMSVMKSNKSMLMRSQTGDFDHNRWLFETKGTYGIGNAFWPKDEVEYDDDGVAMSMSDFLEKPWKPLTRKVKISPGILSPYRLLVLIRLVFLSLFLTWRVRNPNQDAMWLWGLSIVCEIWFAFSWLLDQMPKLNPINRAVDLVALREKFESPTPDNPLGRSDLPGLDVLISTADPEKEPPLVTANTILSILATEYPVEKLFVYISDDGAAVLTFEAMSEAAAFARVWVPFCRKHNIEPRNPDSYFAIKGDPTRNKKCPDFVKDRRWIKREYDEFKVRINGLPDAIRRRSAALNAREEMRERKLARERSGGDSNASKASEAKPAVKATWMADATHWPGTWAVPSPDHSKGDHAGIIQVMIKNPHHEPLYGAPGDHPYLDFTGIDTRLPMFVYVSREKRPGYDHNKKAGAMNAMVRASAILSNGPFILNFDCDHYIYNSLAIREGMCYMMDRGGDRICYVQFPQRFEGIDPSDRYANHNTVFFDGNMRALDGLQGPMYVGTGCLFRRYAVYGFNPPRANEYLGLYGQHKRPASTRGPPPNVGGMDEADPTASPEAMHPDLCTPVKFGNSKMFTDSIAVAEFQGRPLADHPGIKNGRPPGALLTPRPPLDAPTVAEAVSVISCWYEDKTEWGQRVGWIYGSVTEDVVTGYRMHNRGWRSVYCITKRDAFRGTAPINLTDRLHQVLRWATGSVEIFFSRNNAFLACSRLKFLQRIAYLNWSKLLGGLFFSFWVLAHMYPFAKGLMGRRGRTPTIVYVWAGLLAIVISLLWISISPPDSNSTTSGGIEV
uniref:Cellulose synthase-like protein D1 n=1 Tax=Musa acuminata subsp. malaccensis TaxID=214687 RepID=A0A804I3Q3_MUSAM